MSRLVLLGCALALASAAACATDSTDDDTTTTTALPDAAPRGDLSVVRTPLSGDIAHYAITLRIGAAPNAVLHLHRVVRERAPGLPRPTAHAVMLLHGDFSSFGTNFLPGLAPWLAAEDIDVWGLDRRWAAAPADADLSDYDDMGLTQELDDIGRALGIARATRSITGSGAGRVILSGFSRGGQLAYAYASSEAARPSWQRHIDGLIPLDVYYAIAPEDEALRQTACANAAFERDQLAAGVVEADNSFFVAMGELALSAPDEPSPLFEGMTNLGALLFTVGQTYVFFPATPLYHLLAPVLDASGTVIGLRETPIATAGTWFAGASPHQSMRELAESDGLWCNEPPLAIDAPLDRIEVPLLYLGAAGGFGDHGLYSTTQVRSHDVTTEVIRRLDASREAEDFGHADLLFATDAPALAWPTLASWIRAH